VSAATGGEGASGGALAAVHFSLPLSFVGQTKERGMRYESTTLFYEKVPKRCSTLSYRAAAVITSTPW
jgi:hypothetical protein